MTHNLPEEQRSFFGDENIKYLARKELERRLCPVHRHIIDSVKTIEELVVYGLKSNNCNECRGKDYTCAIYRDYISKEHLRGIE